MSYRDLSGYLDPLSRAIFQIERWERIARSSLIDDALSASRTLTRDFERLRQPLIEPPVATGFADVAGACRTNCGDLLANADVLASQRTCREEIARATGSLPGSETITPQDFGSSQSLELQSVVEKVSQHAAYQEALDRLEALHVPLRSESALTSHLRSDGQTELRALLDQPLAVARLIEARLPGVEWKQLNQTFGSITRLQSSTQALVGAYRGLCDVPDSSALGINSLAEAFAPVEVLNHTQLLWGLGKRGAKKQARPHSKSEKAEPLRRRASEEARTSLLSLLQARCPKLLPLWQGAREALNSKNPDRVRHCSVSYREVLTHLLHLLAPDEQVLDWVDEEPDYLHDGRLTRKDRVRYLCRNRKQKDFGPFVVKDVDAVVEIFRLVNKGTHALETDFSARDLLELQIRADNLLLFLLRIAEESDSPTI